MVAMWNIEPLIIAPCKLNLITPKAINTKGIIKGK